MIKLSICYGVSKQFQEESKFTQQNQENLKEMKMEVKKSKNWTKRIWKLDEGIFFPTMMEN